MERFFILILREGAYLEKYQMEKLGWTFENLPNLILFNMD